MIVCSGPELLVDQPQCPLYFERHYEYTIIKQKVSEINDIYIYNPVTYH